MRKNSLERLVTACAFMLGVMWGTSLFSGLLSPFVIFLLLALSYVITFLVHGVLEVLLDIDDPIDTRGVLFLSAVFLLGALVISELWIWAGLLCGILVIVGFFLKLRTI